MTLSEFLLDRIAEDERLGTHDLGLRKRWPAECEAKRRIVELHGECGTGTGFCDDGGHGWNWPGGPGGCGTLAFLALPYADHPDYRQEWAP